MLKRTIWALLALMIIPFTASACGMSEKHADGYENTAVKHAHQHWSQSERSSVPFEFIDVRTAEEFAAGHIKGAKLIPFDELAKHLNEIPKNKQVYLYCRTGQRSSHAASLLAKQGYTNIENVLGGITEWTNAGYQVVK